MKRELTLDDTQREALLGLLDEWGDNESACAFIQELYDTGVWDADGHRPPASCRWAVHEALGGHRSCYGCWWLHTVVAGSRRHSCKRFGMRDITGADRGGLAMPERLFPDCFEDWKAVKERNDAKSA